jgi:hypothetical protein
MNRFCFAHLGESVRSPGFDIIEHRQNPQLVPLYRSQYHKIESIELVPGAEGGVIVGTDDENFGSYVYFLGASN